MGQLFPQQQDLTGSYRRSGRGRVFTNSWSTAFNLTWELDFWGRFRRAVESADASLDASVFNYDDVLVTLLSDVATNYVQIRTDQERLKLLENTVKIQADVYSVIKGRVEIGFGPLTPLDLAQAESNLKQSQAQIAQLKIDIRTSENRLCTLLGIPTVDLEPMLAAAPKKTIPEVPNFWWSAFRPICCARPMCGARNVRPLRKQSKLASRKPICTRRLRSTERLAGRPRLSELCFHRKL